MAVSQKQIAEKLGVSIALVSRVLSGRAEEIGIAPDTIERVLHAAQQMGYVPSAAALALKGKATKTLGVVVYDFKDPFFGAMIGQLQLLAHQYDYSLVLAGFLNRIPDEKDLQPLHKHAIDGLLVIGTDLQARWLKQFRHLPTARIGHGAPQEESVQVAVDEAASADSLIRHLAARGCSRAVFASAGLPAHRLRAEAVTAAAQAAGLHCSTLETIAPDAFQAGMCAAAKLPSSCDALICATDQVAIGAIHSLGANIESIAVTGFDDIDTACQLKPALTTMRQPVQAMAAAAIDAVISHQPPERLFFSPELIIRESA